VPISAYSVGTCWQKIIDNLNISANICQQIPTDMPTSHNKLQHKVNSGKTLPVPGKPFKSKLIPHFANIKLLRKQRKTWQEIADELNKTLETPTDRGSVCAFFKRHRARPYPMGCEPDFGQDNTISRSVEENPNGGDPVKSDANSADERTHHADNPNEGQPKVTGSSLQAEANALRAAREEKRKRYQFGSLYKDNPGTET
jgi:hypothetical protein